MIPPAIIYFIFRVLTKFGHFHWRTKVRREAGGVEIISLQGKKCVFPFKYLKIRSWERLRSFLFVFGFNGRAIKAGEGKIW